MYRSDLIYEAVSMTNANCFALRPCAESTELIIGVYGRAMELFPSIRLYALNPLSNHDTSIMGGDPDEISAFIGFVKTNISKELRELHGLPFSVFGGRRVSPLPISPDAASMEYRLRYVLRQGTKEDLVESPRDWPGVTGVHSLERGEPLVGWWFDRDAERQARARGESFDKYTYATRYEVQLSPLPCWDDLPEEVWRARVRDIVDDIVATEAARRRSEKKTVLGAAAVMAYSPTFIPETSAKSPSPLVLASSKAAYRALRRFYENFCELFWEQSRRSRQEPERPCEFPPHSFPPGGRMTPGPALPLRLTPELAPG